MSNKIALLLIITMVSCSPDDTDQQIFDSSNLPQKWTLVGIGFFTDATKDDELFYEETIDLFASGLFAKTRRVDGDTIIANGTFEYGSIDDRTVLSLHHDSQNETIATCSNGLTESFAVSAGPSLSGGKVPCDGDPVFYELNRP